MTERDFRTAASEFASEAKRIYGPKLNQVILYGSCARGNFAQDSDIDLMVLLDVPDEDIKAERRRMDDISDELDMTYDVVLAPVFQSFRLYQQYMPVSAFYQNVQREGVRLA